MTTTAEQFVKTWQASKSIVEATKALGCKKGSANTRAGMYRKIEIPLKKFSVMREPLDVLALKKLAESYV